MNNRIIKGINLTVIGFIVTLSQTISAQQKNEGLSVGDHVPDIEFNNVMNATYSSARLSDFKDKYVVLDFFATWCRPCIVDLPKLGQLALKFSDKLVILALTREDKNLLQEFFKVRPGILPTNIPMSFNDTTTRKLFPHRLIPHTVIISPERKVVAVTQIESLTAENIERLLKKDVTGFKVKKDVINFNPRKPLLLGALNDNVDDIPITFSSVFTPFIPGVRAAYGGPIIQGNYSTIQSTNASIDMLYQSAFGSKPRYDKKKIYQEQQLTFPARLIWEARDSSKYYYNGRAKDNPIIQEDSQFCYELIMPVEDVNKLNSWMVTDLNRYFGDLLGIEGVVEKRKIKCLSLVREFNAPILKSRGGKEIININAAKGEFKLNNTSIDHFLHLWVSIHQYRNMVPIINESDYEGFFDLSFKADPLDVEAVSTGLEQIGFKIIPTERELEMIVIRDKK